MGGWGIFPSSFAFRIIVYFGGVSDKYQLGNVGSVCVCGQCGLAPCLYFIYIGDKSWLPDVLYENDHFLHRLGAQSVGLRMRAKSFL